MSVVWEAFLGESSKDENGALVNKDENLEVLSC